MRLSCPNCTAKYDLDERLLPPSGAPVQCTTCNHVFLAMPTSGAPSGSPEVPASAAELPASGTMRFGAEQTQAPAGRTGIYGAARRPETSPPTAHATSLFGAVSRPAPETAAHRTPAFGAVPAPSNEAGEAHRTPSAPVHRTTAFGFVAAPESSDAHRTNVFGAVASPPAGAPAHRTAVFGAVPGASMPSADFDLDEGDDDAPELAAQAPANQTIPFAPFGAPMGGSPRTVSSGMPALGSSRAGIVPPPARGTGDDGFKIYDDAGPKLSIDLRRVGMVAAILATAAVLVFAAREIIAWSHAVPREILDQEQGALTMLRRDDASARHTVASDLDMLIARAPKFVEARADRALALALELDDLQAPLIALANQGSDLDDRIARLSSARSPSDWSVRVNALRDRQAKLHAEADRIHTEATARRAALNHALAALPDATEESSPRNLAVIRARAVAAGVEGNGTALELAERYSKLNDPGGWAEVVLAEYVLNAHAPPETVDEVKTKLRQLRALDPSFLRPYVLLGRMDLADNHRSEAVAELEAAVALDPDHLLAKQLLSTLADLPQTPQSP